MKNWQLMMIMACILLAPHFDAKRAIMGLAIYFVIVLMFIVWEEL